MNFLLDTNVISEWAKPAPDQHVIAWFGDVDSNRVYASVASIAEIRYGIEKLPAGRRRRALDRWLNEDFPLRFDGRLLPIDGRVSEVWGSIMARSRRAGTPLAVMDGFFAATAAAYDLTLVTRNVGDFRNSGIRLLDPWVRAG